ncbi:MAG: redoxin domain-containing protein, partial [Armatimonadetes bacterium]|nr:redoxin domain-containing protein [Armatimonadota bacterium]
MPNPGDKAPAFEALDTQGNPLRLADFAGRPLVLYFYPKDST